MPIQIAVGQIAGVLQVRERQSIGMGDQTRADRQATTFVEDPFQAGVGKGCFLFVSHAGAIPTAIHRWPVARIRSRAERPTTTARYRPAASLETRPPAP